MQDRAKMPTQKFCRCTSDNGITSGQWRKMVFKYTQVLSNLVYLIFDAGNVHLLPNFDFDQKII